MNKIRTAKELSKAQIADLFEYNPSTGAFLWKNAHGRCTTGSKAGCLYGYQKTHLRVSINQKTYDVPSLIWILQTGSAADRRILHRNSVVTDNSWNNLYLEENPPHGSRKMAFRRPACKCDLCVIARKKTKDKYKEKGAASEHGLLSRYHAGCRCEACRGANADHYRDYRKRKGTGWVKEQNLKRVFGIRLNEYEKMKHKQDFRCLICKRHETEIFHKGLKQQLVVDHDHVSGKIRGLLCSSCNRAIGLLKDDPVVLLSAYEYLKKHKQQEKV
jgi:hypothetical protein